jgi:hypothetical protein
MSGLVVDQCHRYGYALLHFNFLDVTVNDMSTIDIDCWVDWSMINHKSSLTCSDGVDGRMDGWMNGWMEEDHPCVRSITT